MENLIYQIQNQFREEARIKEQYRLQEEKRSPTKNACKNIFLTNLNLILTRVGYSCFIFTFFKLMVYITKINSMQFMEGLGLYFLSFIALGIFYGFISWIIIDKIEGKLIRYFYPPLRLKIQKWLAISIALLILLISSINSANYSRS